MKAPGRFPGLILLLAFFPGCRNTAQELLETELRTREWQVRDLKEDLAKSRHLNQALLYEIAALRRHQKITPEQAAQTFGLKRIVLGRMTGAIEMDGLPGDDALEIYLEPRDSDDHAIKAPGTLHILALEITNQGMKNPIGAWEIPPDHLRKSWKTGLLITGYVVTLPWQQRPASENVRLVARLVLTDGRAFEADRDIKVRLRPRSPAPHPMPPADELELPPPRKVEPKQAQTIPDVSVFPFWRPSPIGQATK